MEPKKFNWGTLILGVIIGAIVVGVVWMASKPAVTGGQVLRGATLETCQFIVGGSIEQPDPICNCGIATLSGVLAHPTLSGTTPTSQQCTALNGMRIGDLFTPSKSIE